MKFQLGFVGREACLAAVLGVGVVWDCYDGGFHVEVRAKSSKGLEKGSEFPILEKGRFLMKVSCKNMICHISRDWVSTYRSSKTDNKGRMFICRGARNDLLNKFLDLGRP